MPELMEWKELSRQPIPALEETLNSMSKDLSKKQKLRKLKLSSNNVDNEHV